MNRTPRVVSVVAVLVVLFMASWWFLSSADVVEESVPSSKSPMNVEIRRIIEAPQPVQVIEVVDAGEQPSVDAGVESTWSTHYLAAGNVKHEIHDSDIEFQRVCTREAEACAERVELDRHSMLMASYELDGTPGNMRVVRMKRWNESDPLSPFAECLFNGMKSVTFTETVGKNIGCTLHDFRRKRDPTHRLIAAIGACVGPKSEAEAITVILDQRVVGNSVLTDASSVVAIGRLDLSAENCIRAAARLPPKPGTKPLRHELTVVLSSDGAPSVPRISFTDVHRLKDRFEEKLDDPSATAEDEQLARRSAMDAEDALRREDARTAKDIAERCVETVPSELGCHRALARAWLMLIRDTSNGNGACEAWVEFLRRAPPGDPDAPRIRVALIRSGITPP